MFKSVLLREVDDSTIPMVNSLLQELLVSSDSEKIVEFDLRDTIAPATLAGQLISLVHASNVDLHIKASGNLSPGATLIAAAGNPGFRSATCTTKFGLTDSGKKLGKKALSIDENYVYQFLALLCKDKKSKIQKAFYNYGAAYATGAVSLSIIDEVSDFKDKYAQKKEAIKEAKKKNTKSKKLETVANPPSDNSNSTAESSKKPEVDKKLFEDVDKQIKTPEEEVGK